MTRNFIFSKGTSQKWWSIEVNGKSFNTVYGKIAGSSQSTLKTFATSEKCQQAADKLIVQKLKEKYEEVPLHIEDVPVWDLKKVTDARTSRLTKLEINAHQSLEFITHVCSLTALKELTIKNLRTLPPAIGQLKNLKTLKIEESPQLKIIPDEIGQLKNLEFLTIFYTDIKKLPDSIGQLAKLSSLSISLNVQLRELPDSINQLAQLNTLIITSNRPARGSRTPLKLPDNLLKNLNKLEGLYLSGNGLTTLPESLASCKAIKRLDISRNKFREMPPVLFNMSALLYLDFDHLDNCTVIPETILQLKKLKYFSFDKENIKNIPKEHLHGGIDGIRKHFTEK